MSWLINAYQQLIASLQKERDTLEGMETPALKFPPMILKWMGAVSKWEGANPALNNPGNLKFSTLTASWGATEGPAASDGGHLCQFKTLEAGQFALCSFLQLGCEDELVAFHAPEARTLAGFTTIYAGNPPQGYITGIEEMLGVPGTTQISTFLS